ncbi:MAG TPA: hypothetical protein VGD89_07520 [Flavipsychrobacter sp.]|jgi:hypothetical protein
MNSKYDNLEMTRAEKMVGEFLDEVKLYWEYEQAVYLLDDKGRPRVWTPDYYLPELGFYIEVVGDGENPNYSWRKSIYDKNRIPIIFIYPYEHRDWQQFLVESMHLLHRRRWDILKQIRP